MLPVHQVSVFTIISHSLLHLIHNMSRKRSDAKNEVTTGENQAYGVGLGKPDQKLNITNSSPEEERVYEQITH